MTLRNASNSRRKNPVSVQSSHFQFPATEDKKKMENSPMKKVHSVFGSTIFVLLIPNEQF